MSEKVVAEGYWWCAECKEEVAGCRVTYQELHEDCGHPVVWIESHVTNWQARSEEMERAACEMATDRDELVQLLAQAHSDLADERDRVEKAEVRAQAAERRLKRISEIMAGWGWHEGKIEGPDEPVDGGGFVATDIRLRAFEEIVRLLEGGDAT